MFWDVFRFELLYRFKRPPVYFFAGLFFLMTISVVASDSVQMGSGIGGSARNSPYEIVSLLSMMSAFALMAITGFVATAVNRDYEFGTHEIFYSTPVRKGPYLTGRFMGAVVVTLAAVVAAALGMVVGTWMPWLDPQRILPFDVRPYAYTLLVYTIPNLFILGAFLFSFATLTRKVFLTYLAMLAIIMGWGMSLVFMRDLESVRIASLVDPFGLAAFKEATRYWTVVEQNSMLPPISGTLLLNRLIWIAAGAAALAATCARFRMSVTDAAGRLGRRARNAATAVAGGVSESLDVAIPKVTPVHDGRTRLLQWLDQTRAEMASVFRSVPFLVIISFGVFNLVMSVFVPFEGTVRYPLTRIMVQQIEGGYWIFLFLVLLVYAGQLVWRERHAKMNEIQDALPVPDWMPVTAKFTALAAITGTALVVAVLTTVFYQVTKGYFNFEWGVYLRGVFLIGLSWWLIFTALMLAVQVFVNNKILGFVILFIYYVLVDAFPSLGVDHHLIVFGTTADPVYSDMNGYGHYVAPVVWYNVYWALISVVLVLLGVLFWVRGTDSRGRTRFREAGRRARRPLVMAIVASLVAFAGTGAYIFHNTNVLNDWKTSRHVYDQMSRYEERYKQYEDLAQPRITDVRLAVDIYPEARDVEIEGRLVLENKTDETIETLHVSMPEELEIVSLGLPDEALEVDDEEVGYRIYALEEPLEPGDTLTLDYSAVIDSRGFRDRRFNTRVVENGTFLDTQRVLPTFGYAADGEITNTHERRKRGMEKHTGFRMPDEPGALDTTITPDADWVSFEAVVSTSPDQVALTAGSLVREWDADGRRYFHYKADSPILNFYPFLSGKYDVARDTWNDVAVEVYYHPTHAYNVERMIESVKRSLDYYTAAFGPYQHDHLRIVEFPRYSTFAQSFPGIIPYSEGAHFIEDLRDEDNIDMVFYITAHEVAHQWWGHQVAAAWAKGATFIEESMAQYSALMVMEQDYGRDEMERFLTYELDRYLRGRAGARREELPLIYCDNQPYIHYYKGSLVTYALREYLGEERMNEALRSYVERTRYQGPPYPGSLEFAAALREATPPEYQYLIDDMVESITLYDNRCEEARYAETEDGRYRVTMSVSSRKVRADGLGVETGIDQRDWIEIGVYGEAEGDEEAPLIYLDKHMLVGGDTEIEVVVDGKPSRAGIDPRHLFVDRVPDDNTRRVALSDRPEPDSRPRRADG